MQSIDAIAIPCRF